MNFEKVEESQSSPKKERKRFNLPSDQVLSNILDDLFSALPSEIGDNSKIYITGSAAINRFGAMKRELKDIDVVIQVNVQSKWATEGYAWEEKIKEALLALPDAKEVDYAPIPDVELQHRFELQGYPIEAFVQTKGEETINVSVPNKCTTCGTIVPFATLDSIFSKKWLFNKEKAQKDLWNIRDHLSQWKPKEINNDKQKS